MPEPEDDFNHVSTGVNPEITRIRRLSSEEELRTQISGEVYAEREFLIQQAQVAKEIWIMAQVHKIDGVLVDEAHDLLLQFLRK